MRRSFVIPLVALATMVTACSAPAQPLAPTAAPTVGPPKKIGIAYSNLIADSLSLWVARESGIFARNGLDVDLQYIASSNAFAALLAGQVQASAGGGSEVISGTANGADVVVIVNLMPIYPYFMEAPADIRSPADLKGRSIAITNLAATYDYYVAKAPPTAPRPEQFTDSQAVLAEQNPAINAVELPKMLDASYF